MQRLAHLQLVQQRLTSATAATPAQAQMQAQVKASQRHCWQQHGAASRLDRSPRQQQARTTLAMQKQQRQRQAAMQTN